MKVLDKPGNDAGSLNTSVTRAFAVLEALSGRGVELNLTQLSDASGLSKSTTWRMLNTLQHTRMVQRRGSIYSLGQRASAFAGIVAPLSAPDWTCTLREAAMPFLQDLFRSTGQTVQLGILRDTEVLYLEKIFGHNRIQSPARVGHFFPAAFTALGKALLAYQPNEQILRSITAAEQDGASVPRTSRRAYLEELRRSVHDGVAYDRQAIVPGLSCVACVVELDLHAGVRAAISISGTPELVEDGHFEAQLRKTARNIQRAYNASYELNSA